MSDQLGVYKAITAVMAKMAAQGIGKNSKNAQQGWQFRGIDAVYNALAPLLSENNLIIFTRVIGRTVTERTTAKGGVIFYVVVDCEFDFVCSLDGSRHTVRTVGEAMDSGDKATNKAMSIALKYAAFQTFFIPTEVTVIDADGEAHNISAYAVDDMAKQWIAAVRADKTVLDTINDPAYKQFIKEKAGV